MNDEQKKQAEEKRDEPGPEDMGMGPEPQVEPEPGQPGGEEDV